MSSSDGQLRFFDGIARRYDRVYAPDTETSRRRLARVLCELSPGARVLDLGVGTGRELSALLDAGHTPTGFDWSEEMLALCARRSRPVPLVRGNFWLPLPFLDGSFDAIIALHGTLAHPPARSALSALAAELARVLREDGVLVAEVPSPSWLEGLQDAGPTDAGLRAHRIGPDCCVHEDLVANVSIEATVLASDVWRTVFRGWSHVVVEPLESSELLIVAKRAAVR